jgi:hypothetical protein|nr:MAG TPA: hypothetical protein [Bacteriophage sp.]
MKGEVLVYIEGENEGYKLYDKDIESACDLYYGLEKYPIYIERPDAPVKTVVEKLDTLIEAILDTHKFREEKLRSFYENARVKEWRDARDRRVLSGALINRNYEGNRIADLIGWLESREAIIWNDRETRVAPYKLNNNLILIFS